MKTSEKWGDSVDAAVKEALKELKLFRDEVDIEIIERSSNGFDGDGSTLVKVRVTEKEDKKSNGKVTLDKLSDIDDILANLPENRTVMLSDEVRENYKKFEKEEMEDARKAARVKKEQNKKKQNKKQQSAKNTPEESLLIDVSSLEEVENHSIIDFLKELTEKMGLNLEFSAKTGDKIVYVDISGPDTATIIGKRGQTLDAVQYLSSLFLNKNSSEYIRVILDAENYRAKREKTLVNLANRLAGKVERSGRRVVLEPMNPYERKVIHSTLQNSPKVVTRSEGKDPYRRVIIERK